MFVIIINPVIIKYILEYRNDLLNAVIGREPDMSIFKADTELGCYCGIDVLLQHDTACFDQLDVAVCNISAVTQPCISQSAFGGKVAVIAGNIRIALRIVRADIVMLASANLPLGAKLP